MKNYVKVLGLLSMGAMMWGATQAATLTVSSAGLYQEVDAAIAAANNGDTISVTPDKVYAPFTVNKIGLTFSGNGSIIDGN